jgi:hypothetical protein
LKITECNLVTLEEKGVLPVASTFTDMVYAVDKQNGVIWLVDRRTGAQIEIAAENVAMFANELMDVADIYVPVRNLWKVG